MFLDFFTVFHMVWKNQESLNFDWLGFGLLGVQKCEKFPPTIFFHF